MESIGRYNVIAELGRGATGTVYKALDGHLNRLVAIKVLSHSGSSDRGPGRAAEMFFREARTVARLLHPGIVQIYDVVDDPKSGVACMVMEFVAGGTLASLLPAGQPLALGRTLDLAVQIGQALEYAHSNRFLHLDLKPENILLTQDGRSKIADFGLARFQGRVGSIVTESLAGTPAYIAPERVAGGPSDERSDLFSLGVIFYQMLTGYAAFDGTMPSILHRVLHDHPRSPRQLNPALPPEYDALVTRCLAKDPDQRIASAREFLREVEMLPRPVKTETLGGLAPIFVPVLASSSDREKNAGRKEGVAKPDGAECAPNSTAQRRAWRSWQRWSITKAVYPRSGFAQYAGLLLLSFALVGRVNSRLLNGRTAFPSTPTATVLAASTPFQSNAVLDFSRRTALDTLPIEVVISRDPADLLHLITPAEGSASGRPTLDKKGSALSPRRSRRRRTPKSIQRFPRSSFQTAASFGAPGMGLMNSPSNGLELLTPRQESAGDMMPSAERAFSGISASPVSPGASGDLFWVGHDRFGAAGRPPALERLRFVCDHDLRDGTLTVSLDGKVAFHETLKGKRRILRLDRNYHGLYSRVMMIPPSTSRISVEVATSDLSLKLDDMMTPDAFGSGPGTLRATVKSGALRLKWEPAQGR